MSLSNVGTVPLEAPFVLLHGIIGPGIASWYQVSQSAVGFAIVIGLVFTPAVPSVSLLKMLSVSLQASAVEFDHCVLPCTHSSRFASPSRLIPPAETSIRFDDSPIVPLLESLIVPLTITGPTRRFELFSRHSEPCTNIADSIVRLW